MKVAELLAEQKHIERRKAAEFEAESLKIQQKVEKAKAHVKVLDEKIENENIEERKSDDRENRIHSRCRYEDDQNLKEQVHWPENMSRKGNRLSDDPLVNIKANVTTTNNIVTYLGKTSMSVLISSTNSASTYIDYQ